MARPLPEARSHLPEAVERRLLKPYSETASGRVGASALLRAVSVLVRRHPRAALDMLGAGALQAGRSSLGEVKFTVNRAKAKLLSAVPGRAVRQASPDEVDEIRRGLGATLSKRQLRQLRKVVRDAEDGGERPS